jgi:aryl-alcohol dehydrogenase-like predicted oxidoreductase
MYRLIIFRSDMRYTALGRTGLQVARLCLGGNVFGWTCDEERSYAVLDAYVAGGGNFIDSADVYSRWAPGNQGGESEAILGRWMAERGNRSAIILATKCGSSMGDWPNQRGLARQHIMNAVEASLRRLKTDYIDLYQAHIDDLATPLEETLRAFDDLVRQGKVRYIGSNSRSKSALSMRL